MDTVNIKTNYADDDNNSSKSYREQLCNAKKASSNIGFTHPSLISEQTKIKDEALIATRQIINQISPMLDYLIPGYWGNKCQTLSSIIFAHLNHQNIKADIVIGNVIIDGIDEFETTLDSLRSEFLSEKPLTGEQSLHAWVSLGDDTIIDAALPPRLVRHYKAPKQMNDIILIGRASEFSKKYSLKYQPILVGTDFFAKTNPPDPIDFLHKLRASNF